jgi:signal transduction histidine kinase
MSGTDQLLPTISALVALGEFSQSDYAQGAQAQADIKTVSSGLPAAAKQQRAEREWQGALAALSQLLTQQMASEPKNHRSKSARAQSALVLCGPVPLLNQFDPAISKAISNWTFVPRSSEQLASSFSALSPVGRIFQKKNQQPSFNTRLLPLLEEDPLAQEQFVLALTPQFSLVLVLGKDADDDLRFQFSFMPQVVNSVWRSLRSRLCVIRPQQLEFIDPLVEKFAPKDPNYRTVSQFNRWMLACLPQPSPAMQSTPYPSAQAAVQNATFTKDTAQDLSLSIRSAQATDSTQFSDGELLKAMAHEIRTPLTTIRTYTRSLLKRDDLDAQVIKRLRSIDRECTQQIDRFGLIFRAVELEAASQVRKSPLSAIALHQVFREAIPQWQQAAQRRNITLEVGLPSELPMVASDPTMLQHVLTGLVELFTHSVSPGSHIQLQVIHAGEQLKLQFQSQADPSRPVPSPCSPPPLQSLGRLLMFQPETGGLSLNLEATKNLFRALGAKLTVRERSSQGTTWAVYLPLEASGLKSYPIV